MSSTNSLEVDIGILKTELHNICSDLKDIKESQQRDIHELRANQKLLLEFMYKVQGGKAWLFSLLTISAAVGALLSAFITFIFPHK